MIKCFTSKYIFPNDPWKHKADSIYLIQWTHTSRGLEDSNWPCMKSKRDTLFHLQMRGSKLQASDFTFNFKKNKRRRIVESAETDHFILAHPPLLIPSISRSSLAISLRQKINWDLLSKRATYGNDHYAFIQVLAHVWTLLSCFIYYGTLFSGYVE